MSKIESGQMSKIDSSDALLKICSGGQMTKIDSYASLLAQTENELLAWPFMIYDDVIQWTDTADVTPAIRS